jgi:hypothetical protein
MTDSIPSLIVLLFLLLIINWTAGIKAMYGAVLIIFISMMIVRQKEIFGLINVKLEG